MRFKQSGQRTSGYFRPATPQRTNIMAGMAAAAAFGQQPLAVVDGAAYYSPVVPVQVIVRPSKLKF